MLSDYIPFKSVEELEDFDIYKYVRLSTGEVRFLNVLSSLYQHKDMVTKEEREQVVSAGVFTLFPGNFKFNQRESDSLNTEWCSDDEAFLEKVLNRKHRNPADQR